MCFAVQVRDAASEKAFAFFVEQAKKLETTSSKDVGGVASGDSSAIAAAGASMLFPAQQLARRLQTKTKAAARSRQLKRDALELLEKTDENFTEGLSSTDAERLEQRLRAFARVASGKDGSGNEHHHGDLGLEEEEDDDVEVKLEVLKREVTNLRRTTVAGLNELKLALAEIRASQVAGSEVGFSVFWLTIARHGAARSLA